LSSYDPRERTITWLETNDVPANITKDNDTTAASYIYQFEKPTYPLSRVFFDPKNVDGIYTICTPTSVPLEDWKHEVYAYIETVPIEISCVSKQGITGDILRWKMEKELRRIAEVYSNVAGSFCVRNLHRMTPKEEPYGRLKVFSVRYELEYKRAAEDYTSDVTYSYGNYTSGTGFHYGGDRLDNGVEGQWGNGAAAVDDAGGSTITQSLIDNILTLNCTVYVGDAYTNNATNLGLSTSLATKIRFRYRTTGNATAKIIVTDDGAYSQTVLSETASSTWSIVTVSLTAAKTLDHIRVYLCDGTGTVEVDWLEIYAADFVLPNVVNSPDDATSRNVDVGIASGIVTGFQNLGASGQTFTLELDTDMETSTYDWTRAGDAVKGEVFYEIQQTQSIDAPWQWLDMGDFSMRVQIDSIRRDKKAGMMYIQGHEYSESSMDDTYAERWNI